ncbi:MAG: hypothetical protein HRT40_11460 [Campylobacteraceae bacterium]|nr:hypothetical protein [Campylobacteraceae bacterium]
MNIKMYDFLIIVISYIPMISYYCALYKYAFKMNYIWSGEISKNSKVATILMTLGGGGAIAGHNIDDLVENII